MQGPRPSTSAQEKASDAAQAWLQARIRWEDRLDELHALAARDDHVPLPDSHHRVAPPRSGVLEPLGCSEGVCA